MAMLSCSEYTIPNWYAGLQQLTENSNVKSWDKKQASKQANKAKHKTQPETKQKTMLYSEVSYYMELNGIFLTFVL